MKQNSMNIILFGTGIMLVIIFSYTITSFPVPEEGNFEIWIDANNTGHGGPWIKPSEPDYTDLWNRKPEILKNLQRQNKTENLDLSHWFAVTSKISSLNRTAKLPYLPEILVQYYPDWINGTSYIAMTNTSEEYTLPILEQFNLETQKYIRFIKAPAPLIQIREWEQLIWNQNDLLEEKGVIITSTGVHFDGRILLGLEDVSEEKIKILCENLEDVPLGILAVYQASLIILN